MSVTTTNRLASIEEIAAEMDRRGQIIERLETRNDELEKTLRGTERAIAEFYRYHTGGEMRGSYDGRPEREGLWKAMRAARSTLAALVPAPQPVGEVRATHRHKKRGSKYVLLGIGKMQAEWWVDGMSVGICPETIDMRDVAIYRSVTDGQLWVRPREEFEDGRFEVLSPLACRPGGRGMSSAKEIIGQAFGLAHRNSCYPHASKDESDVAAGIIIGRLEAAGFRILAPDELDPATVERCAQRAERTRDEFLSPQYATNQPASSFCERFACDEVARSIRTLTGGNTPLTRTG